MEIALVPSHTLDTFTYGIFFDRKQLVAATPQTPCISTLVIIFVHYVARSYCETIKLPQEMPNPPEADYRFY